ncbi:TPA: hypothetical protein N0F65_002732 [Lagenidium giganteum]|uniref:DNA mismatch repair proteins mutS family domain-containing protein n=1 Tax=Lagenidium giganteum TaxID=4803 RepID=A0AAV2Z356_9STRA|nr:TPA: hypothetical protein N0F65_002732 [Lagenidium giganteum]
MHAAATAAAEAAKAMDEAEALTEMEKQVVALQAKYPTMLLLFECGYRMRVFGRDAEIASRVLGISVHQPKHFLQGSVPVCRAMVHTRTLTRAGHKVGIVKQLDTAAMRAQLPAAQRKATLDRDVAEVYTWATVPFPDDEAGSLAPRYLLALTEAVQHSKMFFSTPVSDLGSQPSQVTTDGAALLLRRANVSDDGDLQRIPLVQIGFLAHDVHAGETFFGEFDDGINVNMNTYTFDTINHYIRSQASRGGELDLRVEYVTSTWFDFHTALNSFTTYFDDAPTDYAHWKTRPALPRLSMCCFLALSRHLESLRLSRSLLSAKYTHWDEDAGRFMKLPAQTEYDLDLFVSSSTRNLSGSLFSIMNRTLTSFGERKLLQWLRAPLVGVENIRARQSCVRALATPAFGTGSMIFEELTGFVLPLSRPLQRVTRNVHQGHAKAAQVISFLDAIIDIEPRMLYVSDLVKTDSSKLQDLAEIVNEYPRMKQASQDLLNKLQRCSDEDENLEVVLSPIINSNPDLSNEYQGLCDGLAQTQQQFTAALLTCRTLCGDDTLQYCSFRYGDVKQYDYLIELERCKAVEVPSDWMLVNSTTKVLRYQPRAIVALQLQERYALEMKSILLQRTWRGFLEEVDSKLFILSTQCVEVLAELDALCSMASLARSSPGYVLPEILSEGSAGRSLLKVEDARHPVVEQILPDSTFIPNSIELVITGSIAGSLLVISGPNMGGKSTFMRMCCLIVMMAQIGSYVPAKAARLTVFDAILTRMHHPSIGLTATSGSEDLPMLALMSRIATAKSLVVIDELGHGFSPDEEAAVVLGSADYFANNIGCMVLLACHSKSLIAELQAALHGVCVVKQFSFSIIDNQQVVFTYRLADGVAASSFALQTAAAAGVPHDVISAAKKLLAHNADAADRATPPTT